MRVLIFVKIVQKRKTHAYHINNKRYNITRAKSIYLRDIILKQKITISVKTSSEKKVTSIQMK